MVPLSFAGQAFEALPEGALYWPARRALLVADLHFEKASWFAARGQMLPPYDTLATLTALADIVARCDARELWCLGDSFHDAAGGERLSQAAQAVLSDLTQRLDWTWITGNHDPAGAARWGGHEATEAEVDGILLRHEAAPGEARPEMSGHFHPKLRLTVRGRRLSRRCFVATQRKLILPAFGSLTGGLDAGHPEILRAVGPDAEALIAVEGRLLRFPVAA
ncbi:ligase-associated DNA damage response endonuclease PdeM [Stakelama tenebrarum]|uniref:Ligase-associated DNA damage response endonuclease PdeM n=1 Tax=Stakelama tenebrarum TaxID=2711215 RepID=A0A6G6Y9K7_9SPHN|nr:ligase-associated DNA damage response endonuclease PdeM [Sphingosinithalassobacter tenebrarum]QIG81624.1 ligase-associated DNA damage response endonuclease PdeM [Sphingosinithalassobacter tenebrarum]